MKDSQLRMWDETPREQELRTLTSRGVGWKVLIQVRECADRLYRGRLVFRSDRKERATADLFVAPSFEEVVQKAEHFEEHLVRQLLQGLE